MTREEKRQKINQKKMLAAIQEGEGLFQEFKTSLEKVDRSMVAFANTRGGVIYLGVNDSGQLQSFPLTNRIKAQIHDIAKNIDPSLTIECISLGKIAVVLVKEGEDKPYKCTDGFFIRVGATNQKLSRDQILSLAVQFNRVRFETLQNIDFSFAQDFSRNQFNRFLSASGLQEACETMGTEPFLISLGICEKQRGRLIFNNAGILFFAKNPQKLIPQARLNYVRYQGTTKAHVIDRVTYVGTLPEQWEAVAKKLRADMPVAYRLADREKREERPYYPMRALEEAIINALIHRDYYEAGAEVLVESFSDRIEVSNPGSLLGGLTIDRLENKSIRRNPLLAELFFRIGTGEKLGSGIARMKALMEEWKLSPPRFETNGDFFSVVFIGPKHWIAEETMSVLPPRLMAFVEKRNQISEPFTTASYASLIGVTQRTAQIDLKELTQKRIIRKSGQGKNTQYWFESGS